MNDDYLPNLISVDARDVLALWDEIERLRTKLDAIDALHRVHEPQEHEPGANTGNRWCEGCGDPWPCATHRILDGEGRR